MNNNSPHKASLAQLLTPAIQRAVDAVLLRHRRLGESIAVMQDDQIVILTGDEIPVAESVEQQKEAPQNLH